MMSCATGSPLNSDVRRRMNRHRTAVATLADQISRSASRAITDEVAQRFTADGETEVRIVAFAAAETASDDFTQLKHDIERLIVDAAVEDLRDTSVVIRIALNNRVGRCVGGSHVTQRRFNVAEVSVKASVRTRWVHMFSESAMSRQWVVA